MTTTVTPSEQRSTEPPMSEQMSEQRQPNHAMYPPSYGPAQPAARPRYGLAVTGLVLGVIGLVLALTPITFLAGIPLGVLGLVFGAIGFRWGLGKAGAILGAIAIVLGIMWSAFWGNAFNDTNTNAGAHASPVAAVKVIEA